ncbi:thermonuclease family protein [Paenibacillus tepidiphilus]|uniref:thermonuclease family protein n=1 Tax=Paenibacillus tepidiphilus TaxID=2608683 RepID=UPI00123A5D58|nr:thermonuclease family protein [Paenibacillus tepidiphilus]
MFRSKKYWLLLILFIIFESVLFSSTVTRNAIIFNLFLSAFASIPAWLIGMIKPSAIIKWGPLHKKTRLRVTTLVGSQFLASALLMFLMVTINESNSLVQSLPLETKELPTIEEKSEVSKNRKFIEAKVTKVTDGDTFTVALNNGQEEKIRMLLIDTPETKHPDKPVQPFGEEASTFSNEKLAGQTVKLEFDAAERDQYGRLLAYVYLSDESMFNEVLLEKGLARVAIFQPNVKYVDQFKEIEQRAKKQKVGIWSIENYASDKGFNDKDAAVQNPSVEIKSTPPSKEITQSTNDEKVDFVYFKNCDAVRAAGAAPIYAGQPGYTRKLDRDGDGIGCE